MKSLKSTCCLCLSVSNVDLTCIFSKRGDSLTYFEKVSSSLYQLANVLNKLNCNGYLICNKCCETIDMIYHFNNTCLQNVKTYSDLNSESSGVQQSDTCAEVLVKPEILFDTSSNDLVLDNSKVSESILVKQEAEDISNLSGSCHKLEANIKNEYLEQVEMVFLENQCQNAVSEVNGKFYWQSKSVLLLLEEYKKRIDEFTNPNFKKKILWEEISDAMLQHGYLVDSDSLDRKMRNLKTTYKQILDNLKSKKNAKTPRWEYFDIFEGIFKSDKSIGDQSAHLTSIQDESLEIAIQMEPPPLSKSQIGGKFYWQNESTQLMLNEYKKRLHKFRNPKIEKKTLWEEISVVMERHGYSIDGEAIDRKMRNLKITYRTILDKQSAKKSNKKPRWEFFEMFEDIFNNDKPFDDFVEEVFSMQDESAEIIEVRPSTSKIRETFHWQNESIQLMLDEYKERIDRFRNPKIEKKSLWEEISVVLGQNGYCVDYLSIDRKMRNMKSTYRTILDNLRNKNSMKRPRWEYFEIFEEFFKNEFADIYSANEEMSSTEDAEPSTSQDEISPEMTEAHFLTTVGNETEQILNKKVHTRIKVHTCNVCNAKFMAKRNLDHHMYTHAIAKPNMCEICGKSYFDSAKLIEHLRSHTGEKPFVCDICRGTFQTKSNLDRHKMIHTGEKPYSCNTCDKRFRLQGDLHKHQRTHTGEKPYVCTFCNRAFSVSSHLIEHRRTHTGELLYSCDICRQSFTRRGGLKKHKLKQHKLM